MKILNNILVAFCRFSISLMIFLYVTLSNWRLLIAAPVPALIVIFVILIGIALQPLIKKSSEGAITDGKSKQSVLIEMLNGLKPLNLSGALI